MEIESKKSKEEEEDRISKLPDEVICHILSFMETKYAFRTSILSTRWKNLWAYVPILDFECESKEEDDPFGFLIFVDRVLSYHSSDIKKFRLHYSCSGRAFFRLEQWIITVCKHNVVELDLFVETDSEYYSHYELPQSVFMCKTLASLKVHSNCIDYSPPTPGCFPSLKIFNVRLQYPDNDLVESIFCCCPVLEELTINAHVGVDDFLNFRVSAPALKALQLIMAHDILLDSHDHRYSFFINCPKLESLDLRLDYLPRIVFENTNSLVKATIDLYGHDVANILPSFSRCATELLERISNVKYLFLTAHSLEVCSFPAFNNLNRLELVLHNCYNWDLLIELLNKSPNLEYLVIDHQEDDNENCFSDYSVQEIVKIFSENQWRTPESVPACLISHIKTITFKAFKGYPHERKVAKYLLHYGKVLNKMTISNELYKELFAESGSSSCRVEFT